MRYYLPLILICIFFATPQAQAKTYEGTIGAYPIAMDIQIPKDDGEVKGTYFYKKIGVNIALRGVKKGPSITLVEHDASGKKTGSFQCTESGSKISGKWISPDGKKEFPVVLTETAPDELPDSQQAAQLDALDRKLLPAEDECERSSLEYTFKNEYIRSLAILTEYLCGPYPNSWTGRRTYNTRTGKDIDLWDEIDPARMEDFKTFLNKETQKKFDEWLAQIPDEDWESISYDVSKKQDGEIAERRDTPWSAEDIGDKKFVVKDANKIMTDFYIAEDGVYLGRSNYFGFPHVIQALDFYGYVILTPDILNQYLKKDSVLRTIQMR